jgi:hypothetical protein
MNRSLVGVLATVALALGLSAPASAATANHHASCAGLAGPSRAGQPGAQAEQALRFIVSANQQGVPPGAIFSDFLAHRHAQTAGICLD